MELSGLVEFDEEVQVAAGDARRHGEPGGERRGGVVCHGEIEVRDGALDVRGGLVVLRDDEDAEHLVVGKTGEVHHNLSVGGGGLAALGRDGDGSAGAVGVGLRLELSGGGLGGIRGRHDVVVYRAGLVQLRRGAIDVGSADVR